MNTPPAPLHPIPTANQLAWQQLEFYAFVHFNMNTFTDMEWGTGGEDPALFNPSELDCRQWCRVFQEAGMKAVILTAKHHDGFCLWQTAHTEHSVKNAPWKDGKGDVVTELAAACCEYGLKFGVYLSPWDRNHPDYGRPAYIDVFRAQLTELLSNYGEVFEVWFDGANGGSGYYGGAEEERLVDKKSYYDWPGTIELIRRLQPNTIIWSDAGPDARWVGNEHGFSYDTTWSTLKRDAVYGGMPEYAQRYSMGQEDGTHWVAAEADVSIRPGWYYHQSEDHKVKSLAQLLDIYYRSVGLNSTLLLNFPVDRRGLVHEADIRQANRLRAKLDEDFETDLAPGAAIRASDERGVHFVAANAIDGDENTYWAAAEGIVEASLDINFSQKTTFNRVVLQEHIALGQRVKAFALEAKDGETWTEIARGTTIGYKRILRLPDTVADTLRLRISNAKACPTLQRIGVYRAPKLLEPPAIRRDQEGRVTLTGDEEGVEVFYTLDDTPPDGTSARYREAFVQTRPATLRAVVHDPSTGHASEESRLDLDIAATKWQILHARADASKALDGDPATWWTAADNRLAIDLGEDLDLRGFFYLPMQDRWLSGLITHFAFYASPDNESWTLAAQGEFGNIANSPILQRVEFETVRARFVKLEATATADGQPAAFAGFSVLTR